LFVEQNFADAYVHVLFEALGDLLEDVGFSATLGAFLYLEVAVIVQDDRDWRSGRQLDELVVPCDIFPVIDQDAFQDVRIWESDDGLCMKSFFLWNIVNVGMGLDRLIRTIKLEMIRN